MAPRTGLNLYRISGSVTARCPLPAHGHFDRSRSLPTAVPRRRHVALSRLRPDGRCRRVGASERRRGVARGSSDPRLGPPPRQRLGRVRIGASQTGPSARPQTPTTSLHPSRRSVSLHRQPWVLAFDGDEAGRESAFRHAMAAVRVGHVVSVTTLPGDHDPASWLAEKGDNRLGAWMVVDVFDRGGPLPRPIPAGTYVASRVGSRGTILDRALLVPADGLAL